MGVRPGRSATRGRRASEARAGAEFATPVLERIIGMGQDTKLYRRNYVLRFTLKPSSRGIQAQVEYEFEVCNATEQRQPFVQLLTVDDSDYGYVESMSFSINGHLAYVLKRPRLQSSISAMLPIRGRSSGSSRGRRT